MPVTLKYYIDAECTSCSEPFRVEVVPRDVSTGGELDVLRLSPTGQLHLKLIDLDTLPATCPGCGEPIE